jgi:hypothetical protein
LFTLWVFVKKQTASLFLSATLKLDKKKWKKERQREEMNEMNMEKDKQKTQLQAK